MMYVCTINAIKAYFDNYFIINRRARMLCNQLKTYFSFIRACEESCIRSRLEVSKRFAKRGRQWRASWVRSAWKTVRTCWRYVSVVENNLTALSAWVLFTLFCSSNSKSSRKKAERADFQTRVSPCLFKNNIKTKLRFLDCLKKGSFWI